MNVEGVDRDELDAQIWMRADSVMFVRFLKGKRDRGEDLHSLDRGGRGVRMSMYVCMYTPYRQMYGAGSASFFRLCRILYVVISLPSSDSLSCVLWKTSCRLSPGLFKRSERRHVDLSTTVLLLLFSSALFLVLCSRLFEKLLVSDALLVKRDAAVEIPSFIRHWRRARECQQASGESSSSSYQGGEGGGGGGENEDFDRHAGGDGAGGGGGQGGGSTTGAGGGSSSGTSSSTSSSAGVDSHSHHFFNDAESGGGGGGEEKGGEGLLGYDPDELADSLYFLPALKKLSSDTIVRSLVSSPPSARAQAHVAHAPLLHMEILVFSVWTSVFMESVEHGSG